MGTQFVNLDAQTSLAYREIVRVTFTERWSIQLDSGFAGKFGPVYDALASAGAYPVIPNPAHSGSAVAVVDVRVSKQPMTAAQLADAFNTLGGYFVTVAKIERLSTSQQALAASPSGATERQQETQQAEEAQDSSNPLVAIASGLGTTLKVTTWLVVGVVAIVLLVYAGKLRNELK